jgi:hypothetical protein
LPIHHESDASGDLQQPKKNRANAFVQQIIFDRSTAFPISEGLRD